MAVTWEDEGLVVAARGFGEHDAIVSIFTPSQGRHAGLVKGGAGKRYRGLLQPGNVVKASWRGRLDEHLGTFTVEGVHSYAALVISDADQLAGLAAMCAMIEATLPEREPHIEVHHRTMELLRATGQQNWPALYARWELGLIADMGYGLDLTSCAATGTAGDLAYVSPKSGRAVSRAAGAPYVDKLLELPAFLHLEGAEPPDFADVTRALALTGHFFETRVFTPQNRKLPASRTRFVARLEN